jgi:YtkA-like
MRLLGNLASLFAVALLCGASCGDGSTAPDAATHDHDGGHSPCEGVPEFSVGLTVLGNEGLVSGTIVEAMPIKKYENDWVVKLSDPDGEPLDGLELYEVEPFMPAHGHDGTFTPKVTETEDAGTFEVKRINLWMKDHWEVRFFVRVDGQEDLVVFHVCVPP